MWSNRTGGTGEGKDAAGEVIPAPQLREESAVRPSLFWDGTNSETVESAVSLLSVGGVALLT